MLAMYRARMGLLLATIGIIHFLGEWLEVLWLLNDFAFGVGAAGMQISYESLEGDSGIFLHALKRQRFSKRP